MWRCDVTCLLLLINVFEQFIVNATGHGAMDLDTLNAKALFVETLLPGTVMMLLCVCYDQSQRRSTRIVRGHVRAPDRAVPS
jgi:hypothetical protein